MNCFLYTGKEKAQQAALYIFFQIEL